MSTDARLEIRQQADGGLTLTGYAAVTEVAYSMGWFEETIARGAFRRSLHNTPGPDVSLLINHGLVGSGLPIARTTAGTLRLTEDDHGLLVNADLDPIDPEVQSLYRKMQRGDLDGQMSFAFKCTDQSWNEERTKRRVLAAEINKGDVSIVNYGANDATSSTIRSAEALQAAETVVPLEVRRRRAELIGKRFESSPIPHRGESDCFDGGTHPTPRSTPTARALPNNSAREAEQLVLRALHAGSPRRVSAPARGTGRSNLPEPAWYHAKLAALRRNT